MSVNIKGVNKSVLLAALFNNSQVVGMGFLQAGRGPQVMTTEQAQQVFDALDNGQQVHDNGRVGRLYYFDYLFGRPLKVDLSFDEVDDWGYDRDNGGPGTLQQIVNVIKAAQ